MTIENYIEYYLSEKTSKSAYRPQPINVDNQQSFSKVFRIAILKDYQDIEEFQKIPERNLEAYFIKSFWDDFEIQPQISIQNRGDIIQMAIHTDTRYSSPDKIKGFNDYYTQYPEKLGLILANFIKTYKNEYGIKKIRMELLPSRKKIKIGGWI